jgi:Holliday junction resolvase RusA-like endonuclease
VKAVRLVIDGKPATKKTSQVIARRKGTGKPFVLPGRHTAEWTQGARHQIKRQYKGEPMTGPVVVNYQIHRAWDRGDLGGFEAAIDDALQGIVIENDSQIIGRATAKHIDRENPRVEILVTAVAA